jgi:hypothetical protein
MKPIMKYKTVTPLLIVLGLTGIALLLVTINYLFIDNNGGMALAGVIALLAFLINCGVLALERVIVKSNTIHLKTLWIIECILIACMALFMLRYGIHAG